MDQPLSDEDFQQLINQALDSLPKTHVEALKNIAIVMSDEPTDEQRLKMQLRDDQLLLGLYEGVPLPARQGITNRMPDKITLFKWPLLRSVYDRSQLPEAVRHTLWHEMAHYYGLNHAQIRELE